MAVGRDYSDVAPTYGTFQGSSPGVLSTVKRLGVNEVEVAPGQASRRSVDTTATATSAAARTT